MTKSPKVNFSNLTFEDFKELAKNPELSNHEKVGFPDDYREGFEEIIFSDLVSKTNALRRRHQNIIEVGPGCSKLPKMLMELCLKNDSALTFIDSAEMLEHLPDAHGVQKIDGMYPDIPNFFEANDAKVDLIIFYSVFQYIYAGGDMWGCLDKSLSLLREGGEIFIGDIPNVTMRKRFFLSNAGIESHQIYTKSKTIPDVTFNTIELGKIDDSIVLSILMRCRSQGFHAWVLPQNNDLSMANRREDILIRKP